MNTIHIAFIGSGKYEMEATLYNKRVLEMKRIVDFSCVQSSRSIIELNARVMTIIELMSEEMA